MLFFITKNERKQMDGIKVTWKLRSLLYFLFFPIFRKYTSFHISKPIPILLDVLRLYPLMVDFLSKFLGGIEFWRLAIECMVIHCGLEAVFYYFSLEVQHPSNCSSSIVMDFATSSRRRWVLWKNTTSWFRHLRTQSWHQESVSTFVERLPG